MTQLRERVRLGMLLIRKEMPNATLDEVSRTFHKEFDPHLTPEEQKLADEYLVEEYLVEAWQCSEN